MSWEVHEAAKKIADGWYSELEETRERNAVLGRENAELREQVASLIGRSFRVADKMQCLNTENERLVIKLNAEHIARQNVEVENGKLRELVEDMLDCIEIRSAFGRPITSEICESFAQRAGELGIEVDALE